MKRIFLVVFAVFFFVFGAGIVMHRSVDTEVQTNETLRVVTSMFVLEDFARHVGGEDVSVALIGGSDLHTYEPSPRDIALATEADVFVYLGLGLDAWAERIAPSVEDEGVVVVEVSKGIETIMSDLHDEEDGGEDNHDHEGVNPHMWLDPVRAITMVESIRDAFMLADADHADAYQQNAQTYISDLQALHQAWEVGLQSCAMNELVVAHDAYTYLASRYDLTIYAIAGSSPEQEPSPRHLATLTTLIDEHQITHIFFEEETSARVADVLVDETDVQLLVLHPIEIAPNDADEGGYLELMYENLDHVRIALHCTDESVSEK